MSSANSQRIAVGADHGGFEFKNRLAEYLREAGHAVVDLGTNSADSVDYPDFAHACAEKILSNEADLGVLICKSGVGMSIAANRHRGVRAVLCSEPFSAEMSRRHNNANVLCFGTNVVGEGLALQIVDAFLSAAFEGGRHEKRVAKIEPSNP